MSARPVLSVAGPAQRRRYRSRAGFVMCAFGAAVAILLVNVVDPYSGATASPEFQQAANDRFAGQAVQKIAVAGEYEQTVVRESFTAAEAPKPVPIVETAASGWAPPAGVPDPGSAKAYAYSALQARGMGDDQYSCLVALWDRESHWNVYAHNGSSGAYGIPQALPGSKMASAGADWETNAATQIEWGLGYITGRYGTPCDAWAHSENSGWY